MKLLTCKSMENQNVEEKKDATQVLEERCAPVARQIIEIIGRHGGPLGGDESKRGDFESSYKVPAGEILQLFLEKDVKVGEVAFIKKLVLQGIEWPLNMVLASSQNHVSAAETALFGMPVGDLGFKKLDEILKADAEKRAKAAEKPADVI